MTIENLEPIMQEPRLTYKDFQFDVGTDRVGDFVDIYVSPKSISKLRKMIGPIQLRLTNDEYVSDDPSGEVPLVPLEKSLNEMHLDLGDSDGLSDAINQALHSMRYNPKYPWKMGKK